MTRFVHSLITETEEKVPDYMALKYGDKTLSYADLRKELGAFSSGLMAAGLGRSERVAIYAEKRFETVVAMFGTSMAGGVYVPINPLLKTEQVMHIMKDCAARVLVTTSARLKLIRDSLSQDVSLKTIIVMDGVAGTTDSFNGIAVCSWADFMRSPLVSGHRVIDSDMAAILYTSGSTGKPKGVILSHRNIVAGADSVSEYLELDHRDRVLSVLPLSFDYGMNQLTATFRVGGQVVLMNYLMPQDILQILAKEHITGLAAVPPLWVQLAKLKWPDSIRSHLRYFTNSGGHMPRETLQALRSHVPDVQPFLMYGLTEAFRSTYLPPEEIDRRPDSIGKAIPNAEILVVRPDGTMCDPEETGELVHRGVHVALGYWGDAQKTAERFKPAPLQDPHIPLTEIAVWSGDFVRKDKDGYLYYVGRQDEMIKTSGYRVSPTEVEEVFYNTKLVAEVAAFGWPHPVLGQAIVIVATPVTGTQLSGDALKAAVRDILPNYMMPSSVFVQEDSLPRNPNGKIDRKKLANEYGELISYD